MPYRPMRTGEVTEALIEAQAQIRGALELLARAAGIAEERELHVKRALDILSRGAETRDLVRQFRELGIPLDGGETPSAAD